MANLFNQRSQLFSRRAGNKRTETKLDIIEPISHSPQSTTAVAHLSQSGISMSFPCLMRPMQFLPFMRRPFLTKIFKISDISPFKTCIFHSIVTTTSLLVRFTSKLHEIWRTLFQRLSTFKLFKGFSVVCDPTVSELIVPPVS